MQNCTFPQKLQQSLETIHEMTCKSMSCLQFTTTHQFTMELNLYRNTVPLATQSAFSPSTSHDNTSYLFLKSLSEHFYSLPTTSALHFCLLSWLWKGFPPKLSSNLHSTMFQNRTLTILKYLLPSYLQHVIHPFKTSNWFPIFWHRI